MHQRARGGRATFALASVLTFASRRGGGGGFGLASRTRGVIRVPAGVMRGVVGVDDAQQRPRAGDVAGVQGGEHVRASLAESGAIESGAEILESIAGGGGVRALARELSERAREEPAVQARLDAYRRALAQETLEPRQEGVRLHLGQTTRRRHRVGVRVVPVAVHAHARGGLWRPMTDASRSSGFEKKRALTRRWRWKRATVLKRSSFRSIRRGRAGTPSLARESLRRAASVIRVLDARSPPTRAMDARDDDPPMLYVNGKRHELPPGQADVSLLTYLRGVKRDDPTDPGDPPRSAKGRIATRRLTTPSLSRPPRRLVSSRPSQA